MKLTGFTLTAIAVICCCLCAVQAASGVNATGVTTNSGAHVENISKYYGYGNKSAVTGIVRMNISSGAVYWANFFNLASVNFGKFNETDRMRRMFNVTSDLGKLRLSAACNSPLEQYSLASRNNVFSVSRFEGNKTFEAMTNLGNNSCLVVYGVDDKTTADSIIQNMNITKMRILVDNI